MKNTVYLSINIVFNFFQQCLIVFGVQIFHLLQFSSVQSLSRVQLFATPWAVAYQAPLSMGFSRQ